jgi:hypothetical protein
MAAVDRSDQAGSFFHGNNGRVGPTELLMRKLPLDPLQRFFEPVGGEHGFDQRG